MNTLVTRGPGARLLAALVPVILLLIAAPRAGAATWNLEAVAAPAGVSNPVLTSVSCVSAVSCVAVGNGTNDSVTFGGPSSGGAWRLARIARGAEPNAVSCATARFCMALGGAGGSVVDRWDGTAWSRRATKLPRSARLTGVSCVSSSFCMVVGSEGASRSERPLAAVWNGARWRVEHTPSRGGSSALEVVSCPARNACFAAGDYEVRTGRVAFKAYQLIERWNGQTWVNQHVADYRHLAEGATSISCTSPSSCLLVGSDTPQGNGLPEAFAERWNGRRWKTALAGLPPQLESSQQPALLAQLSSVSCWAANACLTVGSTHSASGAASSSALAMLWNGRRWQPDPDAVPAGGRPDLLSVSCVRSGTCMIVGDRGSAPLAERSAKVAQSAVSPAEAAAWLRTPTAPARRPADSRGSRRAAGPRCARRRCARRS